MNTSGAAIVPRIASQARSADAVVFHSGSTRSRRPLPRMRMFIDGSVTSPIRRPVNSDTRSPAQTAKHQVQRGVDLRQAIARPRVGKLGEPQHFASMLQPRQPGWSQWHASAVTFFESWQTWLQYFCLSGVIQLQAGCAHFFASAITSPPHCHESSSF